MLCYNHLTINKRESILLLRAQHYSVRKIAEALNRSPSTISRELRRNKCQNKPFRYSPSFAQKRYEQRRLKCRRTYRLHSPAVWELVSRLLKNYWSPEQISNRLKLEKTPSRSAPAPSTGVGRKSIHFLNSNNIFAADLTTSLKKAVKQDI